MPRDASGVYTLPIAPFVPLTLAKSADMNTALTDIADALTDSQSRAAPTPAQGDLNLNGHNILNLGEVVGDLNATGAIFAEGITSHGNLGVAGEASVGALTSNDHITSNGTLGVAGLASVGALSSNTTITAAGNITTSAAVTANGITSNGNVTATGTVTAGAVTTNGITSNGALVVTGNASVGGSVTAGSVTADGITSNGALVVTGNAGVGGSLSVAGTIGASGAVRGSHVAAYLPSGQGGFVGSWQGDSAELGFINAGNYITFGNGDGSGGYQPGSVRMQIDNTGNIIISNHGYQPGGGSWLATSDARIKTVHRDYKRGLDAVLALRPVVYSYKGNDTGPDGFALHARAAEAGTVFVGLVAQEAEAVMPEMVKQTTGIISGEPVDDLRVYDSTALTYALVNSVKELSAQVTALQAEVAALRG